MSWVWYSQEHSDIILEEAREGFTRLYKVIETLSHTQAGQQYEYMIGKVEDECTCWQISVNGGRS